MVFLFEPRVTQPQQLGTQGQARPKQVAQGLTVITLSNPIGEPIEPTSVIDPFMAIRVTMKENIPIKYRYQISKDKDWEVPIRVQKKIARRSSFYFLDGTEVLEKGQVMYIMGNLFKYFKYQLNHNYVKNGTWVY